MNNIKSSRRSVRKSVSPDNIMDFTEDSFEEDYPADDLIDLSETSLKNINTTLSRRFKGSDIYTSIDTTFLLSINPFGDLPIYTDSYIESYANADLDAQERYPPHIYELAEQAYRNMLKTNLNQSILITGESGSGKSSAAEHILKFLTIRTTYSDPAPPGYRESELLSIADKLLALPTILRAFGCGRTGKSQYSSRVGMYTVLYFDNNGVVRGAKLHPFCMDTTRVVLQRAGDSNYGIFDYLFTASTPEFQEKFLLDAGNKYPYYPAEFGQQALDIGELRRSMMVNGISLETQDEIFSVLAAILHLGNIQFTPSGETTRLDLRSIRALRSVAKLLEIPETALRARMTSFETETGHVRPANANESSETRDAFAKTLYRRLYYCVINLINRNLAPESGSHGLFEIGILDAPGYENLKVCTFEQFKPNFTDEIIQAIRNQFLFLDEQVEYEEDGLAWEPIPFKDNSLCVRLLAGEQMTDLTMTVTAPADSSSVAGLLNPRGREYNLATLMGGLKTIKKDYPEYIKDVDDRSASFRVQHYFGSVSYDATTFVLENSEPCRFVFTQILQQSKNGFLQDAMSISNILEDMDHVDPSKPATAMARFYQSFQSILRHVSAGSPWFIQCIKSNARGHPDTFDQTHMMNQLEFLDIRHLVHMRQRCYPIRLTFLEFYDRYSVLLKKKRKISKDKTITDLQPTCVDIIQVSMEESGQEQEGPAYQIGIYHVYLTSLTHSILEYLIELKQDLMALEIQRVWRGYQARKIYRGEIVARIFSRKLAVRKIERAYTNYKTKVRVPVKRVYSKRLKSGNPPVPIPRRSSSTTSKRQSEKMERSASRHASSKASTSAWDMFDLEDENQMTQEEIETEIVDFLSWGCSVLRIRNELDPKNMISSFVSIIRDGAYLLKLAAYIYPNLPSPEELLQETEDAEGKHSLFLDVCEKFTGIEEPDLYDILDILGPEVNVPRVLQTLKLFRKAVGATPESMKTLQAAITRESMFVPVDITNLNALKQARRDGIQELIKSEEVFVDSLRIIVEFRRYMAARKNVLHPLELRTLFGNVEEMLDFHEGFILKPIKNVMAAGVEALDRFEIGFMFRNLVTDGNSLSSPRLDHIYERYFENVQASQIFLINNSSGIFKSYLELFVKSSDMGAGTSLAQFLLLPLTRAERYNELLKDLEKNTPSSHNDKAHLTRSIMRIKSLVESAETKKIEIERLHAKEQEKITPTRLTALRRPSEHLVVRKPSVGQISQSSTVVDRAYPNVLKDLSDFVTPTRKFICKGSVWEVINTNMVKERSLFLFSDSLIITKEVKKLDEDRSTPDQPVYDVQYMVKTIIHLGSVTMRLDRDEDPFDMLVGSPVMNKGMLKFEQNPKSGIQYLLDKGLFSSQPSSIAQFLYRANFLNKRQVGKFIGSEENQNMLTAFLDCFDLAGIRIDEGLRVFLSTFRLPGEPKVIDSILEAFSKKYRSANPSFLSDSDLTLKLVFAILMLNADLHRRADTGAFEAPHMTFDEFMSRYRAHDDRAQVSERVLYDIYQSVKMDKIGVGADSEDGDASKLSLVVAKMPFRQTIKEYSKPITVTIPIPDPDLVIKLFPQAGLKCYPSVLTFQNSGNATFRLYGESVGKKSIAFLKTGARAHLYSSANLPFGKPVIVEPPFMRHVFQIKAKGKDPATQRKVAYMFSVANDTQRSNWAQQIDYAIKSTEAGAEVEHGLSLETGGGAQIMEDLFLGANGAIVIPTNFKL